jgi:hypothetical protein
MPLRIANGAGFLGDNLDAPRRLVEAAEVDVLTLEYLAELTMSILARQREKDPAAGYAQDFLTVLASLLPALQAQPNLRIVTNAGGMNPLACAQAAARVLENAGLGEAAIGVVYGDDLTTLLPTIKQQCSLQNLDTQQPLAALSAPIVSANAYLGSLPLVEALTGGARIIITGRVADAALTVAPAMHAFSVSENDWDRLAAYTVAGHLIECGAQVTGGYSTAWADDASGMDRIGYPIAEIEPSGETVITKPDGSGGEVNRRTVVEQLTYEIGDPAHYLTPDVDADFATVRVEEIAANRVRVYGATGRPATDSYKVSLAYRDGYMAAGELLVTGRDAKQKAQLCADLILTRVKEAGYELERTHVELLGGEGQIMLRVAAHDGRREAVERFTREFAPLITSGPAGLAGYAAGRPQVRPVFAYWPTLVPKMLVTPIVEVRPARDWR